MGKKNCRTHLVTDTDNGDRYSNRDPVLSEHNEKKNRYPRDQRYLKELSYAGVVQKARLPATEGSMSDRCGRGKTGTGETAQGQRTFST